MSESLKLEKIVVVLAPGLLEKVAEEQGKEGCAPCLELAEAGSLVNIFDARNMSHYKLLELMESGFYFRDFVDLEPLKEDHLFVKTDVEDVHALGLVRAPEQNFMNQIEFHFNNQAVIRWHTLPAFVEYLKALPMMFWPKLSILQTLAVKGGLLDKHLAYEISSHFISANGERALIYGLFSGALSVKIPIFVVNDFNVYRRRPALNIESIGVRDCSFIKSEHEQVDAWVPVPKKMAPLVTDHRAQCYEIARNERLWIDSEVTKGVFWLASGFAFTRNADSKLGLESKASFGLMALKDLNNLHYRMPALSRKYYEFRNRVLSIKTGDKLSDNLLPLELSEKFKKPKDLETIYDLVCQVDANDRLLFEIHFHNRKTEKTNVYCPALDHFYELLEALQGGMAQTWSQHLRHYSNKPIDDDYYLYAYFNFQGISALCLMEASLRILGEPMSDGFAGGTDKDWGLHLLQQIANSLVIKRKEALKKSNYPSRYAESLADSLMAGEVDPVSVFGQTQVHKMLKNLERILQDARTPVGISVTGEVYYFDLGNLYASLLKGIVTDLCEETKSNFFVKTRDAGIVNYLSSWNRQGFHSVILDRSPQWDLKMLERSGLSYLLVPLKKKAKPEGAALQFALAHLRDVAKIYSEGQPLESMGEEALSAQLSLALGGAHENGEVFDWFELHPKIFFDGKEIDFKDLDFQWGNNVMSFRGRYYLLPKRKIPSLKALDRFWRALRLNSPGAGQGTESANYYKLPRNQTLELLSLRNQGHKVDGDAKWNLICENFDKLAHSHELAAVELQRLQSIFPMLKPYQIEGVHWLRTLYSLRFGALLADEMGLGKTPQTLCFLESLRQEGQLRSCLVVVPASLGFNWLSEVEKFTPDLPISIYESSSREKVKIVIQKKEPRVYVVTYGQIAENIVFFETLKFNIVLFDEAQNIKNISAQRTTAARRLAAEFKLCLTGTPMENHLGEFYSLMDLIVPGCLGDLGIFRQVFQPKDFSVSPEEIAALKQKTKPLILRRTKKEVAQDLPDKTEACIKLGFEPKQKKIYKNLAAGFNSEILKIVEEGGAASAQLKMFVALMRMRQVCSDPSGISGLIPPYTERPPKIEAVINDLQSVVESGDSAIVFTQFLNTLHRIEKELVDSGITAYSLYGAISRKDREKILRNFTESSGSAVLLMTLKTGGVGLNLTKASYVFHIEPWWNPSVENQATDRAHRMGQTKKVQVTRYIMGESLEEKMEILKERKSGLFKQVFDEIPETMTSEGSEAGKSSHRLTKEDFAFLLS